MSEIRYSPLFDEYVLIAPERLRRPGAIQEHKTTKEAECPFCEGNESLTPPEIYALRGNTEPDTPGWRTRVFPNLYRAVQLETPDTSRREGLFEVWGGFGVHEVVVDTVHHKEAWEIEASEYEEWLKTLVARVRDLRRDSRIKHLILFKNHGASSGATQEHPHTQIVGLPVVPRSIRSMLERSREYFEEHGRSLMVDIISQEKEKGIRVVEEKGDFVAFCPYASAYPFEVLIVPRKGGAVFEDVIDYGASHISIILEDLVRSMHRQMGDFGFNLVFYMPPINNSFDFNSFFFPGESMPVFIRIMPRIYGIGGFELSTGVFINPMEPEKSARLLRMGAQ